MDATPIVGHRTAEGTVERSRRNETPVLAERLVMAAWGWAARPSLLPTVFAPSDGAPATSASEELAARKV